VHLFKSDNTPVASMSTDVNGKYLFTNMTHGDYYVTFDDIPGYARSPQNTGGNTLLSDAVDSDADSAGVASVTTISAGESDLTWDAGYDQLAKLGDYVWHDTDIDGIEDANETGIDNVRVHLFNAANVEIDSQLPSGGGLYLFKDLVPRAQHAQ